MFLFQNLEKDNAIIIMINRLIEKNIMLFIRQKIKEF